MDRRGECKKTDRKRSHINLPTLPCNDLSVKPKALGVEQKYLFTGDITRLHLRQHALLAAFELRLCESGRSGIVGVDKCGAESEALERFVNAIDAQGPASVRMFYFYRTC